jgi:DNA-binding response OmpR family regulator
VVVPSLAGERVLVVEDDETMRSYLTAVIQVEAGEVRAVGDGSTALEVLEDFGPTALVTDLRMPGLDGAELCRRVRRIPRFAHTPILILSGAAEAGEIADIVGLGLIWYLRKGAPPGMLRKELRNLVNASRRVHAVGTAPSARPKPRPTVRPA